MKNRIDLCNLRIGSFQQIMILVIFNERGNAFNNNFCFLNSGVKLIQHNACNCCRF